MYRSYYRASVARAGKKDDGKKFDDEKGNFSRSSSLSRRDDVIASSSEVSTNKSSSSSSSSSQTPRRRKSPSMKGSILCVFFVCLILAVVSMIIFPEQQQFTFFHDEAGMSRTLTVTASISAEITTAPSDGVVHDCLVQAKVFANQTRNQTAWQQPAALDWFHLTKCGALWNGETLNKLALPSSASEDRKPVSVRFVVAFCSHSLDWLLPAFQEFRQAIMSNVTISLTILSKCGLELDVYDYFKDSLDYFQDIRVDDLPNWGGIQHSYAHWMFKFAPKSEEDYILFMDDVPPTNQVHGAFRSMAEQFRIVTNKGFACGHDSTSLSPSPHDIGYPNALVSTYHESRDLIHFQDKQDGVRHDGGVIYNSEFEDLDEFLNKNGLDTARVLKKLNPRDHPLVPVCYGSSFAVHRERIVEHDPRTYEKIEKSLERGRTTEEIIFVMRIWAALLSTPLSKSEVMALRSIGTGVQANQSPMFAAVDRKLFTIPNFEKITKPQPQEATTTTTTTAPRSKMRGNKHNGAQANREKYRDKNKRKQMMRWALPAHIAEFANKNFGRLRP